MTRYGQSLMIHSSAIRMCSITMYSSSGANVSGARPPGSPHPLAQHRTGQQADSPMCVDGDEVGTNLLLLLAILLWALLGSNQ